MSEWWNLDQALIWILTRNLRQVDLGQGDPEGARDRVSNYFSVLDAAIDLTVNPEPELGPSESDEHGEGTMASLIRALRGGLIRAVRPDDEIPTPVSSATFVDREIEPYGPQPIFVLAKPRKPIEAARGAPQTLLFVVLNRADIIAEFPPLAPDHLIPNFTALPPEPKSEPPTHRSEPLSRGEAIPQENHADVLPKRGDDRKPEAATTRMTELPESQGSLMPSDLTPACNDAAPPAASPKKRGRGFGRTRKAAEQAVAAVYPEGFPQGEGEQANAIRAVAQKMAELGISAAAEDPLSVADSIKRAAGIR